MSSHVDLPLRRVRAKVILNGIEYYALECGHKLRVRPGVVGQLNVETKNCPLCVTRKKPA